MVTHRDDFSSDALGISDIEDPLKLFRSHFSNDEESASLNGVSYITPPSLRPSLHIVVLFAQDTRVLIYAKQSMQRFLNHGIDCYLQRSISEGTYIKHTNLVKIIAESHTDFLCVIGDKNYRNQTISARIDEKLCEVTVEAFLAYINHHWSMRAGALDDASLTDRDLTELSQEALAGHIQQFLDVRFFLGKWKQFYRDMRELSQLRPQDGVLTADQVDFVRSAIRHSISIHSDIAHGRATLARLTVSKRNIWETCSREKGESLSAPEPISPEGGPQVSRFFRRRVGSFLQFVQDIISAYVTKEATRVIGPRNPWTEYLDGGHIDWGDAGMTPRSAIDDTRSAHASDVPSGFARACPATAQDASIFSLALPPIPAAFHLDGMVMQMHLQAWTDAVRRVVSVQPEMAGHLETLLQAYSARLSAVTSTDSGPDPIPSTGPMAIDLGPISAAPVIQPGPFSPVFGMQQGGMDHGVLPDPPNLHQWFD
ncbi:hypothetical protein J8273_5665 [Carpediemonas membranifera]|uniref:Uncharacterized protein n=1 Tax=Carpediemonas membranifera TaxID=201153 RepID=A0A8J6AW07_9EUKA|nr:hypothetical protein J8273_5665 [Carpediemonas membranifera]|eukprot:KAG9392955.1 hypothetical protein J8273_5665 [Carpediemonas membranifera]